VELELLGPTARLARRDGRDRRDRRGHRRLYRNIEKPEKRFEIPEENVMKPLNVDSGRIVLFRDRNKSNEKAPDLRGACNIDGRQYEVALWQRESKTGVKYLSGEVKPARDQAANAERPADDSDIPFDDGALRFADASKRRW
jgi:uncharacterized protein (DUF736 family)